MKLETVNGILIDPGKQEVKKVTFPNNLEGYYKLLGCDLIDRVSIDDNNDLIVDDEGLFKGHETAFSVVGVEGMFVGKSVIVGVNPEEGEWIDCTLTDVKVQFYKKKEEDEDSESKD